jgi:hypothetical protein
MAVPEKAAQQLREDSLEKGAIQERAGMHVEESLGSGDSGLNHTQVFNKDDPLVRSIIIIVGHYANVLGIRIGIVCIKPI